MEPLPFGGTDDRRIKKKMRILETIIQRYSDIIEKNESKSAQELKAMVAKDDPAVQSLKARITDSFHPYIPQIHQMDALGIALERFRAIEDIEISTPFWMRFSEILDIGASPNLDKAILLCSLMRALEFQAMVIVTEKEPCIAAGNGLKTVLVTMPALEIREVMPGLKSRLGSSGEGIDNEILNAITEKVLYAFNDKVYIDMQPD